MIGSKVKVTGDIESAEDLLIEGEVNGTVTLAENELVIGNSGRVHADIEAKTVRIEGEVQGDITGRERVVITASGNVRLVHANRGVVVTSQQAQYFTKEERIVLRGDVDMVQNDGHALRADHVIYLLQEDRAVAIPVEGEQVYSQWTLKDPSPGTEP